MISSDQSTSPRCDLCGRHVRRRSRHHCIPRTRHKNKRNKREFSRQEIHERTLMLCGPCHKMIHATLTEMELERQYNTVEALRSHPKIAAFVEWVRTRRDDGNIRVHRTARSRDVRKASRRSPRG